jgi:hypothetical protein
VACPQRVPQLAGSGVVGRSAGQAKDGSRPDDMDLSGVDDLPDGAERSALRPAYDRRVRDQIQPLAGAGDTDVEHPQPAGRPPAPRQVAARDPALAVLDQVEDDRVELAALKSVRGAGLDLGICPGLVEHVFDNAELCPVRD